MNAIFYTVAALAVAVLVAIVADTLELLIW